MVKSSPTRKDLLFLLSFAEGNPVADPQSDGVTVPTLVMTGDQDLDNGSGAELAQFIPGAIYRPLKGTHVCAVVDPDFVAETLEFIETKGR